jgi:hypothetical protein
VPAPTLPKKHWHVLEPHKSTGAPKTIPMRRASIGGAGTKFLLKRCYGRFLRGRRCGSSTPKWRMQCWRPCRRLFGGQRWRCCKPQRSRDLVSTKADRIGSRQAQMVTGEGAHRQGSYMLARVRDANQASWSETENIRRRINWELIVACLV